MKTIFCSTGAYGHTYPLIPLALAAHDAGHDVLFATADPFDTELKAFGLKTARVGLRIADALDLEPGGHLDFDVIARMFAETLPRAVLDDLGPLLAETKPDLVVHEAACVGAFFAAKLAGVPGVCHGFGKVDGFVTTDPAAPATTDLLAAFADTIGVPYEGLAMGGGGDPYLDICPPVLQTPELLAAPNRIPLRPVAVNAEDEELPAFVRERRQERPLVYLTLGTVFAGLAQEVLAGAVEGVAALDVDLLVATGPALDPAALGTVPDNVRLEAWVPQSRLLPHVDLVVHHGGSGTTLAGLAAGRPHLVLPQGADQLANAHAVTNAGAGDWLSGEEFGPGAVTAKVRSLLADDSVRGAARRVAADIAAMPSPEDTVQRLVRIADGARS